MYAEPEKNLNPGGQGQGSQTMCGIGQANHTSASISQHPNAVNPLAAEINERLSSAQAAILYRRLGLASLPVNTAEKRPYIAWRPLQERLPSEQELRRQFNKWPSAGVGIVTGNISRLVVLDVDGEEGQRSLIGQFLPVSPCVITGRTSGGEHRYYRHPGRHVKTVPRFLPGLDSKGDGGFCILPPSIHQSGNRYSWVDGCSLMDLQPPPMPAWLLQAVSLPTESGGATRKHIFPSGTYPVPSPQEDREGGSWLFKIWTDPTIVGQLAAFLGVPAKACELDEDGRGITFNCILGHGDEGSESASLFRMDSGLILYRDWHRRPCFERIPDGWAETCRDWFTLSEVYASQFYRRPVALNKPERAVWGLRLLCDSGILRPANVPFPPLPMNSKPSVVKLYEGLGLFFGCRGLLSPGEPASFSWSFAGAWCGIGSHHTIKDGMRSLMGHGIVRIAGTHGRINLFLPGSMSTEDVTQCNL